MKETTHQSEGGKTSRYHWDQHSPNTYSSSFIVAKHHPSLLPSFMLTFVGDNFSANHDYVYGFVYVSNH